MHAENKDGYYPCKDPKLVDMDDFVFSRVRFPGTTRNKRNRTLIPVFDRQLPAVNKLGISMLLFNFGVGDYVRPHYHLEGTEIFTILKGSILVRLNTSWPENREFVKVARKGDVVVIPKGLFHSQKNVGKTDATVIAAFNSQNPHVYVHDSNA
jgi:quercetin dioxygenase-like cupin family protein